MRTQVQKILYSEGHDGKEKQSKEEHEEAARVPLVSDVEMVSHDLALREAQQHVTEPHTNADDEVQQRLKQSLKRFLRGQQEAYERHQHCD